MDLQQMLLPHLSSLMDILFQFITVVLGIILTMVANLLRQKFNIQVSESQLNSISTTVNNVVTTLNQQIVNDLKEASADGKLTKEECITIRDNAIALCISLLDQKSIDYLDKKYGDSTKAIEVLIENAVVNFKKEHPTVIAELAQPITEDEINNNTYLG